MITTIFEVAISLIKENRESILLFIGIVMTGAAVWYLDIAASAVKKSGEQSNATIEISGGHIDRLITVVENFGRSIQESAEETIDRMSDLIEQLVEQEKTNAALLHGLSDDMADLPDVVVDLIKPELKALELALQKNLRETERVIVRKVTEVIQGEECKDDPAAGTDDLAERVRGDGEPTAGEV